MGLFDRMKRGLRGASEGFGSAFAPARHVHHGKRVHCAHCEHDRFRVRPAQLNTAGMTLAGLDWANETATVLVCARCGLVSWWVGSPPSKLDEEPA